jgi:uncharacterized protein YndB with AHSA1/START domain
MPEFKPKTVYVTYIAAAPEKVWQALTSSEFTRKYFWDRDIELEPKLGGAFALKLPDGKVNVRGKVIAWDPPRKLSVTWQVEWPEDFRKRRHLRDRQSRRGGAAHDDGIPFLERARGNPVRRTHRLAGDPVEPQKPIGNRQGAGDPNGTAAGDDRGHQEALALNASSR